MKNVKDLEVTVIGEPDIDSLPEFFFTTILDRIKELRDEAKGKEESSQSDKPENNDGE